MVPRPARNATKTNVTSAAADTLVLADRARLGAIVYNDSTAILYLSYGSDAASLTNYTRQIPSQGVYEMPQEMVYNGMIRGIWASANGFARVTELT